MQCGAALVDRFILISIRRPRCSTANLLKVHVDSPYLPPRISMAANTQGRPMEMNPWAKVVELRGGNPRFFSVVGSGANVLAYGLPTQTGKARSMPSTRVRESPVRSVTIQTAMVCKAEISSMRATPGSWASPRWPTVCARAKPTGSVNMLGSGHSNLADGMSFAAIEAATGRSLAYEKIPANGPGWRTEARDAESANGE